MKLINTNNQKNTKNFYLKTFNDIIYKKLQEAELEINNNPKRYSKDEILKSINKIINE